MELLHRVCAVPGAARFPAVGGWRVPAHGACADNRAVPAALGAAQLLLSDGVVVVCWPLPCRTTSQWATAAFCGGTYSGSPPPPAAARVLA